MTVITAAYILWYFGLAVVLATVALSLVAGGALFLALVRLGVLR